ncbi:MAG: hypothetical protein KDD37_08330 [Bdellovibrionales bacterium]|nr:hypothetical protein [Bdellovibrionales bacterium]
MSKQKPKLSEALQTSLTSLQEAWKDWENIAASEPVENKKSKHEKLQKETEPLFQQIKDQLDTLS